MVPPNTSHSLLSLYSCSWSPFPQNGLSCPFLSFSTKILTHHFRPQCKPPPPGSLPSTSHQTQSLPPCPLRYSLSMLASHLAQSCSAMSSAEPGPAPVGWSRASLLMRGPGANSGQPIALFKLPNLRCQPRLTKIIL
jgi:hypothetical protein